MGFRSLIEFNKALLAKQVWRIIQKPDSFLARILKARYFQQSDIMDAPKGSNSSFIWQSILWSRDLLAKGLRWRVGNGQCIKALEDAWIPDLWTGKSSAPSVVLHVQDFIGANGEWNEEALKVHFPDFEVGLILSISLINLGGEDKRYWKWDYKGNYSV